MTTYNATCQLRYKTLRWSTHTVYRLRANTEAEALKIADLNIRRDFDNPNFQFRNLTVKPANQK
jgi:hypothetical protein